MKPLAYVLVSLIVAFCGFAPPTPAQSPARSAGNSLLKKEECSIAGMVVKLAGSEPLKKATVQLSSADDHTRSIETSTDAGGRFQLKGIDPGRYRLVVTRNGYVTQEYGQKTPNDPGAVLALRPGQDVKDLLFRLIPSAVIAGRVIDEDGDPIPSVRVSALRETYSEGKRQLSPQTSGTSNDLGEYRLFGLPAGHYFIRAVYHRSDPFAAASVQLPPGESTEHGYAPTYYPSSWDPAKASTFTVKAGEEIPSVEILLRPVSVYAVRGRVYNIVSKRSSAGTTIQLAPRNAVLAWDGDRGLTTVQNQDGAFEIHDVVPGSYILQAFWFEEGKGYRARQIVDVGNADVEGVALTIAPGIAVNGRIVWEGQPSLSGRGELGVYLSATEPEHGQGGFGPVTGNSFVLKDVSEGSYRVSVFGQSPDCFLKSVRFGGVESLEEGFTVRRGVDAALEVTISSRGARIQGAVADADHLPAAGVWVVLVPEQARRNQSRLYRAGTTDQYGRFDLRGIAPGNYKLFSWEKIERGEWEDPDFLRPFEGQGETITVQEGDLKRMDLVAIATPSTEQQKP